MIVGGGAAGVAAGRRLHDAGVDCLQLEAREWLGGRAFTIRTNSDVPLDLGCRWLHSGDRNPWTKIARTQGLTVDKTAPPWERDAMTVGFPLAEQADFHTAIEEFWSGSIPRRKVSRTLPPHVSSIRGAAGMI